MCIFPFIFLLLLDAELAYILPLKKIHLLTFQTLLLLDEENVRWSSNSIS